MDDSSKATLIDRIKDRTARLCVVGLGYTGLPTAVAFAGAGFEVTGVDINEDRVAAVNRGESYIEDVSSSALADAVRVGNGRGALKATSSYDVVADADAVVITVPTPLSKTRHPDLSHILSTVNEISSRVHSGMLVVLQSTTYPGTTEELIIPALTQGRNSGFQVGTDVFVAFAPERIDPGRRDWTLKTTPKVVGGHTPACLSAATALYEAIVSTVVPVGSTTEAEMVKLLENTFRATNIALVNEIAIMCDKLGIDVWNIIDAAATKPFGFTRFDPGPGLGGHCIPIDPQYLAWKLRTLNYNARLIQVAEEINDYMPEYVTDKIARGLNDEEKAVRGSRVLCLGVAYKEDVGDTREAPSALVIGRLLSLGADVVYHDPHVPHLSEGDLGIDMDSVVLTEGELEAADCVVVLTPHSDYDWEWIVRHSRLLVDTRNAAKGAPAGDGRIIGL